MADETLYLSNIEAYEKIEKLDHIAHQYYRMSEVLQAANIYKEALNLAESINDQQKIVNIRRWCGASFYEAGKLREALAVLVPIMKEKNEFFKPDDFYVAAIKYIEIAQELPVSLSSIQKGHNNIEHILKHLGNMSWRHMQLRKLSELYKLRGMYEQAINLAQESCSLFQINSENGPSFLAEEYLYHLLHLYLLNHNFEQIKRVLGEWEYIESSVPDYKEMTLSIRQSEMARISGDIINAVSYARKAKMIAETTRHYWRLNCSINALVRAYICANQFENAGALLQEFCSNRLSESLHVRYNYHLLRGDFYLSYARHIIEASLYDDEFGIEIIPISTKPVSESVNNLSDSECADIHQEGLIELSDSLLIHLDFKNSQKDDNNIQLQKKDAINCLRHARQAFNTALHIGTRIDSLLECNIRSNEILKRLCYTEKLQKVF